MTAFFVLINNHDAI